MTPSNAHWHGVPIVFIETRPAQPSHQVIKLKRKKSNIDCQMVQTFISKLTGFRFNLHQPAITLFKVPNEVDHLKAQTL